MGKRENQHSLLGRIQSFFKREDADSRTEVLSTPPVNDHPFNNVKLTRADIESLLSKADPSNQGRLSLHGADLRQVDLSGLSLEKVDLSKAHLEGARLEQSELKGVCLEEAFLSGAHLEDADLSGAHLEKADLSNANLQGADLSNASLKGAFLSRAHLEGANLRGAHLEKVFLGEAHLEDANLSATYLGEAFLGEAHLEDANLSNASLEKADLSNASLEKADLSNASLEGASLRRAHLAGADLGGAHLEKADLCEAHMEGKTVPTDVLNYVRQQNQDFPARLLPANLQGVFFDSATSLKGIILGDEEYGFVSLADATWNDVNLAVVEWSLVKTLGDEREALQWKKQEWDKKRLEAYQTAVRANRQLAVVLEGQGMNEQAKHFSYRAQILQRALFWGERRFGQWLFSGFLAVLTGYGYRMRRIIIAYGIIVSLFALAYFILGMFYCPNLPLPQALLESMTAFHGRVFAEQFNPGTPQIWLTAFEAVAGLIIEGVFIAMLIQRFFGK